MAWSATEYHLFFSIPTRTRSGLVVESVKMCSQLRMHGFNQVLCKNKTNKDFLKKFLPLSASKVRVYCSCQSGLHSSRTNASEPVRNFVACFIFLSSGVLQYLLIEFLLRTSLHTLTAWTTYCFGKTVQLCSRRRQFYRNSTKKSNTKSGARFVLK